MECNINPFIRLKIYVINGNSELVMKGLDKIIITFNKREISNYSQFIEKLNEIYNDYGIVDKISDKEGFHIIEFNNLHINNIWNYISNNDTIYVSLMNKNEKSKQKVSSWDNKNKNSNISNSNNKNMLKKVKNNISSSSSSSSSSNSSNKKNIYSSSSSSSSLSNSSNKNKISKQIINLDSSSSSSSSSKPILSDYKYIDSSSSSSSSLPKSSHEKKSSPSSYIKVSKSSLENKESKKVNSKENNKKKIILKNENIKNKKLYNNLIKNNYEENARLLGQKRKNKNHQKNKYSSFQSTKRKKNSKNNINEHRKIKLNYELIPREKLDDIDFLQKTYPKLFTQGTNIKFKIQELLENGIGVGDYHYGTIDNFNLENKSFLIKNCDSMNEKTRVFMYQYEEDIMCVELKNCVEIWIESENIQKNGEEDKNYKVELNEELKKDFIKRQVEYYFSDSNYEKDSFLKSKEDENGYIPISVIMSFNKIKMITNDKDLFINVLKENEKGDSLGDKNNNKLYELNEDLTKIRKVQLSDGGSI